MVLNRLKPLLESKTRPKLGRTSSTTSTCSPTTASFSTVFVHDTLLQSYVLESHKPHDMDSMALPPPRHQDHHLRRGRRQGAKQIGFDR